MKLCKILIATTLMSCAVLHALAADAEEPQPIYSTDILTMLDGRPIQGYNIGGRTLIPLDDLGNYGFTVTYDDSVRTLLVNKTHEAPQDTVPEVEQGVGGNIIGYTVGTDIEAFVNGHYINTYVVDGKLAAVAEELGDRTEYNSYGFEHSMYNMECVYSNDDRTLSINTNPPGETSYEEKLNKLYEYMQENLQYTLTHIEEKEGEYDVVFLEQNNYDERKITHILLLYHNGLYIDISSILDSVYGFGRFPYRTVFNGQISEDKTHVLFYGERYRPTGMRSAEFIEDGNYSVDLYSGIVSKRN